MENTKTDRMIRALGRLRTQRDRLNDVIDTLNRDGNLTDEMWDHYEVILDLIQFKLNVLWGLIKEQRNISL
jgi:hypothetical protein